MKKKQATTDAEWREVVEHIKEIKCKKDIDELVKKTVLDIKEKTAGKKAAYSWSAGKDSIALQYVCQKAGIMDNVFVYCDLEYTAFMDWVNKNKPKNCTMINTGQDIKWLSEHTDMLFPQDSKTAGKWFHIIQHKGQEEYYKNNNFDVLCLGRRRQDGNYTGKDGIYTNRKGITRYSPIYLWSHEDVLGLIAWYNLPVPPIYNWKNGYLCGTHNWAERQWTGSISNGWKEVYEIEPTIVVEASKYIESAGDFLNEQT